MHSFKKIDDVALFQVTFQGSILKYAYFSSFQVWLAKPAH